MKGLEELLALLDKATPGPWRWAPETSNLHPQRAFDKAAEDNAALRKKYPGQEFGSYPEESIIITDSGYYPPHGADRELIPAAINWLRENAEALRALSAR